MTRELRLDFDGPMPKGFEQMLAWVLWQVRRRMVAWWARRTRHGWHVGIVLTRGVSALEAIALQAILGSDPRRETFNVAKVRTRRGQRAHWNVLYERKITVTV